MDMMIGMTGLQEEAQKGGPEEARMGVDVLHWPHSAASR